MTRPARGDGSVLPKTLTALLVGTACVSFFLLGRRFPADDYLPSSFPSGTSIILSGPLQALDTFWSLYGRRRNTLHVQLDKAVYRPGDMLFARVTAFDAVYRTVTGPAYDTNAYSGGNFQIVGPKGDVVHEDDIDPVFPEVATNDAEYRLPSLGARWAVPVALPGGEYTLRLLADDRSAPAERAFTVRNYRAPRLKIRIEPTKDSYGYGEEASALVTVERAGGGSPAGAAVIVVARVDGDEVYRSAAGAHAMPAVGPLTVAAPLPAVWGRGVGTLTVIVTDGGVVESSAATLPLVASALDIAVFPEGGDLVVDLPSRVYVEGFLPSGEPAEFAADICVRGGGKSDCAASVETKHEGRGASDFFTPRAGAEYELRLTRPAALRQTVPLPTPKARGAVLSIPGGDEPWRSGGGAGSTSGAGSTASIPVAMAATDPGLYRLVLYRREVEVASAVVHLEGKNAGNGQRYSGRYHGSDPWGGGWELGGWRQVALTPAVSWGNGGVLRATLFGPDGRPVAERLVFHEPFQRLRIDMTSEPAAGDGTVGEIKGSGGVAGAAGAVDDAGAATVVAAAAASTTFLPGGRVRLTVTARHETGGHPAAGARVGVTVTDDRALTQGPRRHAHPRLPAMVLLETDVDELKDPAAYLPPPDGSAAAANAAAAGGVDWQAAVDLLLGTRGWRRFAYEDPLAFLDTGTTGGDGKNGDGGGGISARTDGKIGDGGGGISARTDGCGGGTGSGGECEVPSENVRQRVMGVGRPRRRNGWDSDMYYGFGIAYGAMVQTEEADVDVFLYDAITGDGGGAAGAGEIGVDRIGGGPDPIPASSGGAETASPAGGGNVFGDVGDSGSGGGDGGGGFEEEAFGGVVALDEVMAAEGDSMGGAAAAKRAAIPDIEIVAKILAEKDYFTEKPSSWRTDPWHMSRVYAHRRRDSSVAGEDTAEGGGGASPPHRSDFTETVLFATSVQLDENGRCVLEFDLSDSVATFQARVDAYTAQGALGSGDLALRSVRPFFMEAKLPMQVTAGDAVLVGVSGFVSVALLEAAAAAPAPGPQMVQAVVGISGGGGVLALMDPGSADGCRLAGLAGAATQGSVRWMTSPGAGADGAPDAADSGVTRLKAYWLQEAESGRVLLPLVAGSSGIGSDGAAVIANVSIDGTLNPRSNDGLTGADSVLQTIRVVPAGFPVEASSGGLLTPGNGGGSGNSGGGGGGGSGGVAAAMHFTLPEDVLPGTLRLAARLYPTPVALLSAALERLVQEPYGCFEQTSSVTYPMAMALRYMETHPESTSEALREKARALLADGYRKLVGYEVAGGGFEWFGQAPAHEALTAYGLLQFLDMQKVMAIAPDVLKRTTDWILSRRDGKGGFLRSSTLFDGFGSAPVDVTDAYILYSLVSAGVPGLDREIDALLARVSVPTFKDDAYVIGLAAATAAAAGGTELDAAAEALASRLLRWQRADGCVTEAETSITNSRGRSLEVETTAIAVLAWLGRPGGKYVGPVEAALQWLAGACEDGRFGSTQGTVLALKAILATELARGQSLPPSAVMMRVYSTSAVIGGGIGNGAAPDRTLIGMSEAILDEAVQKAAAGKPMAVPTADIVAELRPGSSYEVELDQALLCAGDCGGGNGKERSLPYSLLLSWRSLTPQTSKDSPVFLKTNIVGGCGAGRSGRSSGDRSGTAAALIVEEGGTVDVLVTLESRSDSKNTGMVVAVVGLPGGLEVREQRLRELREEGRVAYYEVRNGVEVVLYFHGLKPREKINLSFDAAAAVAGSFTGAASRAYEYYNDQHKWWVEGLKVDVMAAATAPVKLVAVDDA